MMIELLKFKRRVRRYNDKILIDHLFIILDLLNYNEYDSNSKYKQEKKLLVLHKEVKRRNLPLERL